MKITYHIPYRGKAIAVLRKIREKFDAVITIDESENVTIEVEKRHASKVKKLLSTLL